MYPQLVHKSRHKQACTPQQGHQKEGGPPPRPATLPAKTHMEGKSKPPPRPLRRVERRSAVSSEKDAKGSFGETGGHQKKEQRCDQMCNHKSDFCSLHREPRASKRVLSSRGQRLSRHNMDTAVVFDPNEAHHELCATCTWRHVAPRAP
jgi:hypothetical protein